MTLRPASLALLIALTFPGTGAADDATEWHYAFRYRAEHVDQDTFNKDALASTLKIRLNVRQPLSATLAVFAEVDGIVYLGSDQFNNTRNRKTAFPVVADPDGVDINQLTLDYRNGAAHATLGRQRINLHNQRFIGGVGWRQNEQTYDAINLRYTLADTDFYYAHINKVHRIFGPDNGTPDDTLDASIHLAGASTTLAGRASARFSFYLHDMDFDDAAALSNKTWGLIFEDTIKTEASQWRFPLRVEYARQTDTGNNPVSYSARYHLLQAGMQRDAFQVHLGIESLEGDSSAGGAFRTPLATLHKFQGWADKFLTTPAAGIEDAYVTASLAHGINRFTLVFHDFSAESGSDDYGREWNASWSAKWTSHVTTELKFARYAADSFSDDTSKVWFTMNLSF